MEWSTKTRVLLTYYGDTWSSTMFPNGHYNRHPPLRPPQPVWQHSYQLLSGNVGPLPNTGKIGVHEGSCVATGNKKQSLDNTWIPVQQFPMVATMCWLQCIHPRGVIIYPYTDLPVDFQSKSPIYPSWWKPAVAVSQFGWKNMELAQSPEHEAKRWCFTATVQTKRAFGSLNVRKVFCSIQENSHRCL